MKNHIIFKFLAIFLCAGSLLVCAASAVGVFAVAEAGLYTGTVEDIQERYLRGELNNLADDLAVRYAAENLSNCPEALIEDFTGTYYLESLLTKGLWDYTLEDMNGQLLAGNTAEGERYEFLITPEYPVVRSPYVDEGSGFPGSIFEGAADATTSPTEETEPKKAPADADFLYTYRYQWGDANGEYVYTIGVYQGPTYLVTLYLRDGAYEHTEAFYWDMLGLGRTHRYTLLLTMTFGLLVFAATVVYLCCAAGKKPHQEGLSPAGLNLLPLDVYVAAAGGGIFLLAAVIAELAGWINGYNYLLPGAWGIALCGFGICLLFVGFCYAVTAQCKLRTGYWWRHSLTGILLGWAWKLLKALSKRLRKAIRWIISQLHDFFALLPLMWQWLLTGALMGFFTLLFAYLAAVGRDYWLFMLTLAIIGDVGIVLYGVYAFGTLLKSTKRMSHGDLYSKVNTRFLIGSFREFGEDLNALADVAVVAAKNQMKSERMKAELITNVSHDIKTPLTSIINYVDLLQKTTSPETAAEYLEVLDRQSQRLKKLIVDLMEMSKASTGNMTVDLKAVDAVEAVNQALGEFSDKLAALELTTVFNPPAQPVTMLADGRLTWRVLSNLLSNAVKYALPGTRLYVDLVQVDGSVLISLKNISREQLNVSSEELMERFVRGDASRNTEGSGLGLNIARSLMELQHGQLQLLVDGDLFKATLIFPSS